MKKSVLFTAIMVATALTLSSGMAMAKTYTVRIATYAAPDHPVSKSVEYFKENIEKASCKPNKHRCTDFFRQAPQIHSQTTQRRGSVQCRKASTISRI